MYSQIAKGYSGYAEEAESRQYKKDLVKHWHHEDAKEYAMTLLKKFGKPDEITAGFCAWRGIEGFDWVKVFDESLVHTFPKHHRDFVYSYLNLKVSPQLTKAFVDVTDSIVVDRLSGDVYARCGNLKANAITMAFVIDCIEGKAKPTKQEYARRIMKYKAPDFFPNSLGE